MVTICCTSKLRKRTCFPTEAFIPECTTALGNWYADIQFFHQRQVLLFVSDRSRLAVITPTKEIRSIASHLKHHLFDLLVRFGAKPEWIDAEIREMDNTTYATTRSRSVLGTMNDYKIQIGAMLSKSKDANPLEIALVLSTCPVGPLQYRNPKEVSNDLLKRYYEVSE